VRLATGAALLVLPLLATRSPAALGPRYGGEVRLGLPELPVALVPAPTPGIGPRFAAGLIHETLLGLGSDGQPAAGLAARWSSAADGREWTLSIGEDARFHDDRPVLAEEAKDLAAIDFQVEVVDRGKRPIALGQAARPDDRFVRTVSLPPDGRLGSPHRRPYRRNVHHSPRRTSAIRAMPTAPHSRDVSIVTRMSDVALAAEDVARIVAT